MHRLPDMHILAAVPPVAEPIELAMDEERRDDRRSDNLGRRESDHSPWRDPKLWVSVLGVVLVIVLALLGYISTQLAQINASVKSTNDAVLIVTTKQASEQKSLEDRVAKLESAITTQQQAYNFNFTSRLAGVEAALKMNRQDTKE